MHLLSLPESAAALLALYNPAVFDIHEQRVLSPTPCPHPLSGHPLAMGLELRPMRGTVKVADAFGCVAKHPKVFVKGIGNGEGAWVPFPYIGDILVFVRDEAGPYCVNWTVKSDAEGFRRRGPRLLHRPKDRLPDVSVELRHKIEAQYYDDAGIRTIRITGDAINESVKHNLYELFGYHRRVINIADDVRAEIVNVFQKHLGGKTIIFQIAANIQRSYGLSQLDALVVLRQAIWYRELLVDLYQPILVDRPLRHATRDVLDEYANWFSRKP